MFPKAFGTFKKCESFIFRTETFLQWGDSENLIGSILLLNPGRSKLKDWRKWKDLNLNKVKCASGELILDETMKSISRILEASHPLLYGRIKILNLFNIRNSKSKQAIKDFSEICNDLKYKDYMFSSLDNIYKNCAWIWIGWGVKKDETLDKRRREVISFLKDKNIHCFALYSNKYKKDNEIYIYHPNPHNPIQREDYFVKMTQQMKDFWENRNLNT